LRQAPADLAQWGRYQDPRRSPASHPEIRLNDAGLRISGSGFPGIVTEFPAAAGDCYLVRTTTARTRDGDLLYLGTWQEPQVRSLSGASSAGIPAPLGGPGWFPRERAFCATAAAVRVLVYSEAAATDFELASLEIYRLMRVSPGDAGSGRGDHGANGKTTVKRSHGVFMYTFSSVSLLLCVLPLPLSPPRRFLRLLRCRVLGLL
jgi:hypothetical protein